MASFGRIAVHLRLGLTVLALSLATVLASCGPAAYSDLPILEPDRTDILAPYEAADWPDYLKQIGLARDRDYMIVSYLPTGAPLDLSSPAAAQRTMGAALLGSAPGHENPAKISHTIAAWQCGADQGMASMSGESDAQSVGLFLDGWGMLPAFSTFLDGHLYTEGEHKIAYLDALSRGRGIVMAVEVSRRDCLNMRRALTRFLTHPNKPVTKFSLLLDPRKYEGGGCISFAFFLAGAAGVMNEVWPTYHRELPIYAGMVGAITDIPPSVIPYHPPGYPNGTHKRSIALLLTSPWGQGPLLDRINAPDGELVLAGITGLRRGLVPDDDWRFARMLSEKDPAVARAIAASQSWAAQYPVRRIADPDGVSALVLERR